MNKIDLELDINNGMSSGKIAEKYNKGQSTISYWLKKFKLKTKYKKIGEGYYSPNVNNFNKYGSIYNKINWEECQTLYDTGLSWKELIKNGYSHNGLVWAVKNGKLKMRLSEETNKISHKLGKVDYSVYRTDEHRKKMSKFGGLKEKAGRCKKVLYIKKDGNKTWLQGSWEIKFAQFLDSNNIEWEKNKIGYKYTFKNEEHLYFPDFYLKTFDVYIEVKGYETEKDKEKWKQFPFKLHIVKKKEIQDLDTWWKLCMLV